MVLVTMDATVRKEADKMDSGGFSRPERLLDHRIGREFSIQNRFVDPGEILINDSTGAEIEVPHFRISHLPLGQTNVHPAGAQVAPWIGLVEVIVIRRP